MKKFFNSIAGKLVATSALVSASAKDVFAQGSKTNFDFNTMANKATQELSNATGSVLSIVSILVFIIGGVMLLWAFIKRSKNDGQGNDALVGWGIGLIFTFLGLQVIKYLVQNIGGA